MVAYSELSLMSLMSQGLHALPVLQVNAHVRDLEGGVDGQLNAKSVRDVRLLLVGGN
jgi:hypothetical protein